jgi:hypothetical protein
MAGKVHLVGLILPFKVSVEQCTWFVDLKIHQTLQKWNLKSVTNGERRANDGSQLLRIAGDDNLATGRTDDALKKFVLMSR